MSGKTAGVRLRSDGRYEGRVMVRGESISVYGKTKRETLKAIEEVKYKTGHGTYCKPSSETVGQWFQTWLSEYKENVCKESTIQTYRRVYDRFIEPVMGNKKLSEVRPEALQKLINDLYREGYSKSRVNQTFVVLTQMFKQAQRNGLIMNNPVEAVTFPKFEKKRPEDRRVLSASEQQLFLEESKDSVYYDFYLMALTTGMRINEILALKWSDIDFQRRTINVNGTLFYDRNEGKRVITSPKTASSRRSIPMLEATEKMLHERRREQLENKMKLGDKWKEENGLKNMVFTYQEGGVFWETGIRVDMKDIVKRINDEGIPFEAITPHCFRHSFATRCCESGMPLLTLKSILGHSSLSMTSDLYSHVLPDTKSQEMEKIANLF